VKASFGETVTHAYIPFETPTSVSRFFQRVDPALALIIETEIWPNLYHGCGIREIPLVLVSARISPRSVKSYRRLLPLFRETLSHGIIIAAQSKADAKRFISLGASEERTQVTGNIKFDIELPDGILEKAREFRVAQFGYRPVWIAASTHEGEETIVLDAHQELLKHTPDLVLLLVPRHPERFSSVADLIRKRGFSQVARTEQRPCNPDDQVFLGDTMGELLLFYGASDIALVAGSLVPIGGHNLLEPAALGLPILTGQYVFNAQEIADEFIARSASRMVTDNGQLASEVSRLLESRREAHALGVAAKSLIERNRGSVNHLLGLLQPLLQDDRRED
jgi:3-deoxy-D-manno-octulosonic-acid transferase